MGLQTVILLVTIGLFAGILSGFVGIGGGIVLVPALVFFLGLTQHQAAGTSLALLMTPVGILAVYNYYKTDNVKINYALIIALGFVLGSFFGSKLSLRIAPEVVKKIFATFMLVVAIKLFFSK